MDKLIIVLVGVLLVVSVVFAIQEEKDWSKFKVEHKCKVTGVTEGYWGIGSGSNNNVFVPGTKTYMCDDGISYTKTE